MTLSPITQEITCDVVMNGIDTLAFCRRLNDAELLKRLGSHENEYVLHVTAVFDPLDKNNIKGGWFVAEMARRMPGTLFVVVATDSHNSDGLPSNIFFWGKAKDQRELAGLYSLAGATLLTSKRETFSMICAESLCCGTPVVGFEAGGPESIAIPEYSSFVSYQNLDALQRVLTLMLHKQLNRQIIAGQAQAIYSKQAMTDAYIQVYHKLLNKK